MVWHVYLGYLLIIIMSSHDHFTRSSKKMSLEESIAKLNSELSAQILNLTNEVRSTKDEVLNLKDVIIKRLQEENSLLHDRCSLLENKVISLESSVNHIEQYGRRNNVVISGIPDDISDNNLEGTVINILRDVDVNIEKNDLEACHRIGKSDPRSSSKKTIIRFVNRKYCKKALLNRKNLANINSEVKYNFTRNNKIFINESLTKANESLSFCGWKLKRAGLIYSYYTKDRFVHLKKNENGKAIKIHHMSLLNEMFPEFVFFDDDDREIFVDASPNVSGQSSY